MKCCVGSFGVASCRNKCHCGRDATPSDKKATPRSWQDAAAAAADVAVVLATVAPAAAVYTRTVACVTDVQTIARSTGSA